ncbi:MAG: DUF188 domain-containing protein [Clostridia bacterium]|nr:DUF188 domain-containing protein [Clostridia bacterium]
MKIIVDADACPKTVLQICLDRGRKNALPVWTVASFNHCIISDHHITVGDAAQEADIKIVNIAEKDDIVITQDWGLAAMLKGKQAQVISPDGLEYIAESIEFLLEEREIKAKYRRSGGRTRGPKKRTSISDEKFSVGLEKMIKRKCSET